MTVAAAVKDHVQQVGGAFMFSREAKRFGATTGVEGFLGPYFKGRGGVLGDVDADVVAAAAGFFPLHTVRDAWESVPMPAAEAAAGYLRACQEFGRRKLAAFTGAERLAELLLAVVRHADPTGAPLFAGWRALPLDDDPRGRVLHLTHALRELRGGLHFLAVKAAGLTPLQAVLIGGSPLNDGPGQARWFGWPEPFAEPTDEQRALWRDAEAVTDRLVGQAFEALDKAEGEELAALTSEAWAAVFAR
ncbi:hypothetical protein LO762_30960 [Actinocorallia sp. API 0066]|uniref:SCO6745 family protein n=1 Tax=Actinocorallia sp. API 0066 TaxID=2896846 RepID=UPI001E4E36AD|nr:hypothetical protein [Actinocorallia sp. API 0066]MCD0453571.1 hypothetical protein [Actinocorallia sp. API 0066]